MHGLTSVNGGIYQIHTRITLLLEITNNPVSTTSSKKKKKKKELIQHSRSDLSFPAQKDLFIKYHGFLHQY